MSNLPNLTNICTECGGYENQPMLRLMDNKSFAVLDGKNIDEEFYLKNFGIPVDGTTCVNLNVELGGGELTLFDNEIVPLSPAEELLTSGKLYARGILLKTTFPLNDENTEEIKFIDKSLNIYIERADTFEATEYPIFELFIMFTNPKSNKVKDLINKIKIINYNSNYKVRINALILFGKAE